MKYCKTLLHIYHVPAQNTSSTLTTQKKMDFILVIVSLAGLISAFSFLLTISR